MTDSLLNPVWISKGFGMHLESFLDSRWILFGFRMPSDANRNSLWFRNAFRIQDAFRILSGFRVRTMKCVSQPLCFMDVKSPNRRCNQHKT